MAANLLACAGKDTDTPYLFQATGVHVYSLEEALYHCLHHWKQSVDDLTNGELTDWVQNALGLSLVASDMRAHANDSFSDHLTAFLSTTDYIPPQSLAALRTDLAAWEKRMEWERLKERADALLNHDDAERAIWLYEKALGLEQNAVLLNNLGIAHMAAGHYAAATEALTQALILEPENVMLHLHLLESLILQGEYTHARHQLAQIETLEDGETADTAYFKGEIEFYMTNYLQAVPYYERAAAMRTDPQYSYRLRDVYVKLRQFDKALETLDSIPVKDKYFLKMQAEVHVQANNIPAAIKCVERALLTDVNSIDLWIRLAQYHRLDYDNDRAERAIIKALALAPDNPKIQLEHARIRKAQGRIKDYQAVLHKVLKGFKDRHRENATLGGVQ